MAWTFFAASGEDLRRAASGRYRGRASRAGQAEAPNG